jgi:hypothetical protein
LIKKTPADLSTKLNNQIFLNDTIGTHIDNNNIYFINDFFDVTDEAKEQ